MDEALLGAIRSAQGKPLGQGLRGGNRSAHKAEPSAALGALERPTEGGRHSYEANLISGATQKMDGLSDPLFKATSSQALQRTNRDDVSYSFSFKHTQAALEELTLFGRVGGGGSREKGGWEPFSTVEKVSSSKLAIRWHRSEASTSCEHSLVGLHGHKLRGYEAAPLVLVMEADEGPLLWMCTDDVGQEPRIEELPNQDWLVHFNMDQDSMPRAPEALQGKRVASLAFLVNARGKNGLVELFVSGSGRVSRTFTACFEPPAPPWVPEQPEWMTDVAWQQFGPALQQWQRSGRRLLRTAAQERKRKLHRAYIASVVHAHFVDDARTQLMSQLFPGGISEDDLVFVAGFRCKFQIELLEFKVRHLSLNTSTSH